MARTDPIGEGKIVEVSVDLPTFDGYTRKGIVQSWGPKNVIISAPWCSGDTAKANVRSNVARDEADIYFYVMYVRNGMFLS